MKAGFNLETPTSSQLNTLTRFSGWYIPEHQNRPQLRIRCNGKLEAALEWGSLRSDVSSAYPASPRAIISGFQGDFLCDIDDHNGEIVLAILDEAHEDKELFERTFSVGAFSPQTIRPRSFDLLDVIVCPECSTGLNQLGKDLVCSACHRVIFLRGGVPQFLQDGEVPCLRLTEQTSTSPYSREVLELLNQTQDTLVLDFGAGHTPRELLRSNIVYVDAVQYQWTDIVCTQPRLPFRDQTFSAVVSQAVFEHLSTPHLTAKELYRVLRPGGIIHIDTAFMQPLHGLRQVMAPFEELRSGVKNYQFPSASLLMQFEAILPFLRSRKWRKRIEKWRNECRRGAAEFDQALGEVGRTTLAAGFYFEGRRPT